VRKGGRKGGRKNRVYIFILVSFTQSCLYHSLPPSLRNEEQIRPIPFLPAIDEAIDATIEPVSAQRVNVFFQRLMIGPLNVKFQSANYLDTTYLDQEMRISRYVIVVLLFLSLVFLCFSCSLTLGKRKATKRK